LIVNHIEDFGFIRYEMVMAAASVVLLLMVRFSPELPTGCLPVKSRDAKL
jgi:hypothetical protein